MQYESVRQNRPFRRWMGAREFLGQNMRVGMPARLLVEDGSILRQVACVVLELIFGRLGYYGLKQVDLLSLRHLIALILATGTERFVYDRRRKLKATRREGQTGGFG